MKSQYKYILRIAATFVGAVIGAGFASGQELLQFFANYGGFGLIGIFLAGLGFSLLGVLIVTLLIYEQPANYRELFINLLGKKIGILLDIWISISLFFGISIMFAGCGSIFKEQFGIPYIFGIIISMLVLEIALYNGEEGLLKFNVYLVPLLILITVLICGLSIIKGISADVAVENVNPLIGNNWLKGSLLYISYNLIVVTVVLSSLTYNKLGSFVLNNGCILGGICLGLLGMLIVGTILLNFEIVHTTEIPMLTIAGGISKHFVFLYVLVMWLAMLTTAAANTYCLMNKISGICSIPPLVSENLILLLAFPLTLVGFKGLVVNFYPLSGYIGFVLIIALILRGFKIIILNFRKDV